jgi:hypothetical protein
MKFAAEANRLRQLQNVARLRHVAALDVLKIRRAGEHPMRKHAGNAARFRFREIEAGGVGVRRREHEGRCEGLGE